MMVVLMLAGGLAGLTSPVALLSWQLYVSLKIAKVACQQPLAHTEQAWSHSTVHGVWQEACKVSADTP